MRFQVWASEATLVTSTSRPVRSARAVRGRGWAGRCFNSMVVSQGGRGHAGPRGSVRRRGPVGCGAAVIGADSRTLGGGAALVRQFAPAGGRRFGGARG
ncbi:hypothetical protein GCM10020229_59910 [Kitasatospora albolonga]